MPFLAGACVRVWLLSARSCLFNTLHSPRSRSRTKKATVRAIHRPKLSIPKQELEETK